jgi:pyruvate/2-oxoglutarate dehydrogenase complex dihydrolipoamide acyltransferase (E2) component
MEKRKRRFGDRYDGRLLRTVDPMYKIAPFIMRHPNQANNAYADTVEITEVERFLKKKRAEGFPGMGMLHVFVASYVRVVSQKPELNRFISGQKIFARHHIDIIMMVKKEMSTKSGETSVKVRLDAHDTISDIYMKINAEIAKIKEKTEESATDDIAGLLCKFPRFVNRLVFWALRVMDYHNCMPKSLLDDSLFHGSMFVTDLGSLGIQPVAHHLYNMGNIPLFLAFGAKRRANELQSDGSVVEKRYVDYILTLDDRISDGFYFAQVFKYFKSFIRHPAQLDVPPETIVEDID